MFANLLTVEITAIRGRDGLSRRRGRQRRDDDDKDGGIIATADVEVEIDIDDILPETDGKGGGDTRDLVRLLRMLAFHVCALTEEEEEGRRRRGGVKVDGVTTRTETTRTKKITISRDGASSDLISLKCTDYDNDNTRSTCLRIGSFYNLYPVQPRTYNERAKRDIPKGIDGARGGCVGTPLS